LGIGSAECPMDRRLQIWQKISQEWKLENLDGLSSECPLEELSQKVDAILEGKLKGRTVVNLSL
ncbi:MAG: oxidoreductase, partial [Candidatus Binatia bacterium]